MKYKGRVSVPYELIHRVCGKSQRSTTTYQISVDPGNETIQLHESVKSSQRVQQKASVLTYELVARKLNFPESTRIDAVVDKPLTVADEIPELIFTLSSARPVKDYTWAIAEGATIPIKIEVVEKD